MGETIHTGILHWRSSTDYSIHHKFFFFCTETKTGGEVGNAVAGDVTVGDGDVTGEDGAVTVADGDVTVADGVVVVIICVDVDSPPTTTRETPMTMRKNARR